MLQFPNEILSFAQNDNILLHYNMGISLQLTKQQALPVSFFLIFFVKIL